MNSRLSASSRSLRSTFSRAQFSPLPRRIAPRVIATESLRDGGPLGRLWSRDLLDRLQTPLTRHHE
jgi:hypothetical protein